jgi:nucleoside-diphosphate-sugar epimerase
MRVFDAGASGAIGSRLVSHRCRARGHRHPHLARQRRVRPRSRREAGRARSTRRTRRVQSSARSRPDAIVHQATALANARFGRNFDRTFAQTNRLRTEGSHNLLAAAREAGVSRFVAQSNATHRFAREGGMVKGEDDPLDTKPVAGAVESRAAMNYLDDGVVAAGGIALRYASSAREWLPVLADAHGAKPPRHVPVWLARLFAGEPGVVMGTESRGASNAKARRELGWELRYPSWREGFRAAYEPAALAERREPDPAAPAGQPPSRLPPEQRLSQSQ